MFDDPHPLLEIAIPTYNGSATIGQAIDSILVFIGPHPVAIKIYDNASSDGTAELVQKISVKYSRVSIKLFSENTGFDGNVRRCISHAEADYVWLFSDDDIAPSHGFDRLMAYLGKKRPKILYFNHFPFYNDDFEQQGLPKFLKQDKEYDMGSDFFYDCDLGFISSQVLQVSHAKELEPKLGNSLGHAHLEIAATVCLREPGPYFLIGSLCIGARTLKLPRYNAVKQGFIAKARLFERLNEQALFKEGKFIVFMRQLVGPYFVYTVLKDRAYGITPREELKNTLGDFSSLGNISGKFFRVAQMAACFPKSLAKIVLYVYYFMRFARLKFSRRSG